jgi:hypothetical protein
MSEPFSLEVLDQKSARETAEEALCEAGQHAANPLCDWRCARCWCLLCLTCGEEIDRCTCLKVARHG